MSTVRTERFEKIIANAIHALTPSERSSVNVYLDIRPYRAGALVGPSLQSIRTRRPSIVVFVDQEPLANFSHKCRYRFYDPWSQRFLYETPAQFPPYVDRVPATYAAIHEPVPGRIR